jgi:hypothetical protein
VGPPLILFVVLCSFSSPLHVYSQRKYYEYNNPSALKLTKPRIELLTSVSWQGDKVHVTMKGDKSDYNLHERVVYNSDGTYYLSGQLVGTWKVKYNRYLVHSASSPAAKGEDDPVLGIYSVSVINDSSLALTKLHSSSGDMTRELKFKSRPQVKKTATSLPNVLNQNTAVVSPDVFRKIFTKYELVNFNVAPARVEVPTDQINLIDSLAISFINASMTDGSVKSMKGYFRQYVGYMDAAGDHIIYLNAFTGYQPNWTKELVWPSPANETNRFRVYVNLTKQECFGLHINSD